MTALNTFENELRALIGQPTDLRPFVCDGSPLNCKVFIVGLNPASPMAVDFWTFWKDGLGFDKARWFAAYKGDRAKRPLAPGKKSRPAVSPSRRVIEWLVSEVGPALCLETNIYAAATEEYKDLSSASRISAPFDFLLQAIAPSVIVVHGKDAIAHVRAKRPAAQVIEVDHFSRGWRESAARELGQRVRTMLGQ